MEEKIVIIGSGIAAISAVKTVHEINPKSDITIFSEEKFYPYYRTKISKGLLDDLEEDKLLVQKKQWYTDNNVKLHLDKKVVGLIPKKKEVVLTDGTHVSYSKLLLATGASNFTPPIKGIDKVGVFTLRTLEGAFKILDYLKDAETILLIGGGVQNLETADVLSRSGKRVIIIEFASRLMSRQLDEFASNRLQQSIEAQGVKVMLDTEVQEILGKEKVEGFITKSGVEGACDMVIYSTGIMPNVHITHDADIDVNKGIIVNERMETNIHNIFAAGDVSEFNGKVYGLWGIAVQQGKIAGANICNQSLIFEITPSITSLNAFGLSIFSMGDLEESSEIDLLVEIQDDYNKYYKVFIRNNYIVGTIVLGDAKKFMSIKSLIENKTKINFVKGVHYSMDELIETIRTEKK